jgi:hypothetical protein
LVGPSTHFTRDAKSAIARVKATAPRIASPRAGAR